MAATFAMAPWSSCPWHFSATEGVRPLARYAFLVTPLEVMALDPQQQAPGSEATEQITAQTPVSSLVSCPCPR